MPGELCAVAVCNNSRVKTRELPSDRPKILYHRFPKNCELAKQWAHRCKRADKSFNPVTSSICSEHFTALDYERDLKAELLNITPKRVLKSDAIPSINLDLKPATDSVNVPENNDRETRKKSRESKKLVETLVEEVNIEEAISTENETVSDELNGYETLTKEISVLKDKVKLLEQKIKFDAAVVRKLKKENQNLKRKLVVM